MVDGVLLVVVAGSRDDVLRRHSSCHVRDVGGRQPHLSHGANITTRSPPTTSQGHTPASRALRTFRNGPFWTVADGRGRRLWGPRWAPSTPLVLFAHYDATRRLALWDARPTLAPTMPATTPEVATTPSAPAFPTPKSPRSPTVWLESLCDC